MKREPCVLSSYFLLHHLDKKGMSVYNQNKQLSNCSTVTVERYGKMQKKEKISLPHCECHEIHAAAIGRCALSMPSDGEIASISEFFKILGDPTRLRILFAIHTSPLCVCDIAEMLGMTKSAVSHQLKILRQSALVSYRKAGKNVFYSPADDHVRIIAEMALEHINE